MQNYKPALLQTDLYANKLHVKELNEVVLHNFSLTTDEFEFYTLFFYAA